MAVMLQTFGRLCLKDRSGNDIPFPEKALILICYLLTTEHLREARSTLANLLWVDDGGTATTNLRKLISRIKLRQSEIGIELFSFSGTELTLQGRALKVDTAEFEASPNAKDVNQALQYMAQKVNEGFLRDVRLDSPLFDRWLCGQREALVDRLRVHFEKVVLAPRAKQDMTIVKNAALVLLELRPLDDFVQEILDEVSGFRRQASVSVHQPLKAGPAVAGTPASKFPAPSTPWSAPTRAPHSSLPDAADHRLSLQNGPPAQGGISRPRLVLLPPLSKDRQEVNALAGALIEDITIALCASKEVSVVAPYTSEQISMQSDKAATFEKYSINYVLETRLTQEGGGHSIFTQLVNFGSDEVIWADRFDLRNVGLLHCRAEIAAAMSGVVGREVQRNETARWSMENNPEAFKAYLLGTRYSKQLTLPEVRRSRKLFREALAINSGMSMAMSSLARTYFMEWLLTARDETSLLKLAEERALQAIELDETSALGYRELGVIRLYRRDFDGSLEALDKAEAVSPQFANVVASYADTLVQASRPAEGIEKIKRGIELNPLCPDDYYWTAAGAAYSVGEYQDALDYIAKMKEKAPADRLAAASWAMLNNMQKARQFVRKTLANNPDFELDKWLLMVPFREEWQKNHYREGLQKAGYR